MSNAEQWLERRKQLLLEIEEAPIWVSGSVIKTTRKSNGKTKPFFYLSQSVGGKNKITYISSKHLEEFTAAAAEGERLKARLSELSLINTRLIKEGYGND